MLTEIGLCPATLLTDLSATTGEDVRRALDAAQQAGIGSLSVWQPHLELLGGNEPGAEWLSDAGLRAEAVEAAVVWASGQPEAVEREAQMFAEIVAATGAGKVMAVSMDRALDLATAWELVEPLGAGAGILLDTWHWQRQPGGPDPELLARIPGERIGYVQLCDAAPGDGRDMNEAMSARLLPGDGVVDFGAVFEILDRTGAQPFVATEIFNPALVIDMGQVAFARASVSTAHKVLT
jgi:sugar phosphate isomerase/epimerase